MGWTLSLSVVLASMLVLSACKGTPHRQRRAEAVELAKSQLARYGLRPADFNIEVVNEKKEWVVVFRQKGRFPVPGGDGPVVTIDKETGRCRSYYGD
jgi:hypothetical protein